MDLTDRRGLLRLGAVGIAVGGLDRRPVGPGQPATRGVHIHATLDVLSDLPGDPPSRSETPTRQLPPLFRFDISIEVWGPDNDLSGQGWGAMADAADPQQPTRVDVTQRFFTQRGTVDGDIVRLTGRMLFSYVPGDVGGPVVTEANLATGAVRFYAGNTASHATLEGSGVVLRV
jgi:hypothetical protein